MRARRAADLGRDPLGRRTVAVDHRDLRSGRRESPRTGLADAVAAAGDEDDFPCKIKRHRSRSDKMNR
jgi:hypothetical protein